MGTDIHIRLEKKIDGIWNTVPKDIKSEYGNYFRYDGGIEDRHYRMFAILADVRNGRGFAGVKTGDRIVPISEPKGLPEDLKEDESEDGQWEFGDHSHSWLTYEEYLAYPGWKKTILECGFISEEEYVSTYKDKKVADRKRPYSYSGGISGRDIVEVDEQLYESQMYPDKKIYVRVYWSENLNDAAEDFSKALAKYFDGYDPKDCRLVFGFDS